MMIWYLKQVREEKARRQEALLEAARRVQWELEALAEALARHGDFVPETTREILSELEKKLAWLKEVKHEPLRDNS